MEDCTNLKHEHLKHFGFRCQKVLPLVYDESLSYYEVLCKVRNVLNSTIDTINKMMDEMVTQEVMEAYVQEQVQTIIDVLDSRITSIDERCSAIENEIDIFETEVRKTFDEKSKEFDVKFANQTQMLNDEIAKLKKEVQDEIDRIEEQFTQFRIELEASFDNRFAEIQRELDRFMIEVDVTLENYKFYMENEIAKLNKRIDNLLEEFVVHNPTRGYITNFRKAFLESISVVSDLCLTATEYDSMQLDCSKYDSNGLPAFVLDFESGYRYPSYCKLFSIRNYRTGTRDNIFNVLNTIIGVIFGYNSITASEFDAKNKDCDTLEGYLFTAYDFDSNAHAIII